MAPRYVTTILTVLLTAAATAGSADSPATESRQHQHQHDSAPPEQLGRVEFETSCDPAVQADFNRGVALLHSFWFGAAAEQFTRIAERDPSCGMAWWGVAMSRWGNPFAPSRPVRALEEGRVAIGKAGGAAPRTHRERLYVGAAGELFKDFESVPHRTRIVNYERAMQQLYDAYPKDREAAAFYALAVNQTARPDDKTYAQQLRAAAILEVLFAEQPDHPGAAHYLIHAYDHPPLAERALPAARRYATVAPDAPHALHMPSHTFTRVGLWEESIATNRASADAARRAKSPGEVLHALDYQVYAYLQIAQDRAAQQVIEELRAIAAALDNNEQYGQAGLFAAAAMPARYALERGDWADAARLEPRSTPFPFIDAMTYFARALGAARAGDAAAARTETSRLADLHAALLKSQDEYWAQQVEIQHTSARAWTAFAEGRRDDAVRLLRTAAEIEASTDKAAITPGPLAPARELLGEMLLELDRPADALTEFEAVMRTEPNRFRTLYSAARAASLTGDAAKASRYYAQLVEMCDGADTPARPELEQARRHQVSAAR
jgi:tetratricopeptide (TPR) repeat protein